MKWPTKVPKENMWTRVTTGMGKAGMKAGSTAPKLKSKMWK